MTNGAICERLRVSFILLFACMAFSLMPSVAFSLDGEILWGPSSVAVGSGGRSNGIVVAASSRFEAAALAIGVNTSNLTADQKALLSNSSTGGAFYTFTQQFHNIDDSIGSGDSPILAVAGVWNLTHDLLSFWGGSYGSSNVWLAQYTTSQRIAALTSYELVLAGGGGSCGGSVGDNLVFSGNSCFVYVSNRPPTSADGYKYYLYDNNTDVISTINVYSGNDSIQKTGMPLRIVVPYNLELPFDITEYTLFLLRNATTTSKTLWSIQIVALKNDSYTVTTDTNQYNTQNGVGSYINKLTTTEPYYSLTADNLSYSVSGNTITLGTVSTTFTSKSKNTTIPTSGTVSGFLVWYELDSSTFEPTIPPTNWPEPEPTTPPSVPVVPTPEPPTTPIQPTVPTLAPVTYESDNSYTADLQGILDALAEHCQHLQRAIRRGITDYYSGITSYLQTLFAWLGNLINGNFTSLSDYLHELFEWLAEQFGYSISGSSYNDDTVVSWLKKIWSKLGRGTNTKPVDPVSDPFDFTEWLSSLLSDFIEGLFDLGLNGLGEVLQALQILITKFPFCVPWDIAAMLALLAAEPVTPVVDWPMFTYDGTVHMFTTRIDLSPYTNYVQPVKFMIRLAFIAYLAWKTKDVMEIFDVGGISE